MHWQNCHSVEDLPSQVKTTFNEKVLYFIRTLTPIKAAAVKQFRRLDEKNQ